MESNLLPYSPAVAYFSMEIALKPDIPTYSGGLGVLAGDILYSAADLEVPMVAVTLLHRKGYFRQRLDETGQQIESADDWSPETRLEPLPLKVYVEIEGRRVHIRPWLYRVSGLSGHKVPVFLLDTQLPQNIPEDQTLTNTLYGGDARYRLCQEAVLGLGGVAVLEELGYDSDLIYHMNEGHSALLTLAVLEARLAEDRRTAIDESDIEGVRRRCVFTTHTPVPAGHDQFPRELAAQVLGPKRIENLEAADCLLDGALNMTYLGLRFSHYVNGVSMRHGEVSVGMFPGYPVQAITNGVHATRWTAPPLAELYDRYMPGWRHDNRYLRYAINIPVHEVQAAHAHVKRGLIEEVEKLSGVRLREDVFTVGFARRATPYKRADLLFRDTARLSQIAKSVGPLQVLYAGKAHPNDWDGKAMIQRIFSVAREPDETLKVVYLEGYDMRLARHVVSGTDLWLNTPLRPHEASGTSGMKAACNGVPSLSVLDGWWIEGHIEGVTGWSLLDAAADATDEWAESTALYEKLERVIVPLFYGQPDQYAAVMRSAIALNASFFNTQRVVSQYVRNAYPGNNS